MRRSRLARNLTMTALQIRRYQKTLRIQNITPTNNNLEGRLKNQRSQVVPTAIVPRLKNQRNQIVPVAIVPKLKSQRDQIFLVTTTLRMGRNRLARSLGLLMPTLRRKVLVRSLMMVLLMRRSQN